MCICDRRQALELQRRARSQSAQGATRTQVRRLDLNEPQGSRAHYDMNADAEYQARVARRAAQTAAQPLSLIHISEPTRLGKNSYAVFCLKKKKIT